MRQRPVLLLALVVGVVAIVGVVAVAGLGVLGGRAHQPDPPVGRPAARPRPSPRRHPDRPRDRSPVTRSTATSLTGRSTRASPATSPTPTSRPSPCSRSRSAATARSTPRRAATSASRTRSVNGWSARRTIGRTDRGRLQQLRRQAQPALLRRPDRDPGRGHRCPRRLRQGAVVRRHQCRRRDPGPLAGAGLRRLHRPPPRPTAFRVAERPGLSGDRCQRHRLGDGRCGRQRPAPTGSS